jgi:hypothetical protein
MPGKDRSRHPSQKKNRMQQSKLGKHVTSWDGQGQNETEALEEKAHRGRWEVEAKEGRCQECGQIRLDSCMC